MELYGLGIRQLSGILSEKKISAVEITREYLKRINEQNSALGAYITVCEEPAFKTAERADEAISKGKKAIMTGIPVAVKDNICTAGIRTTCASRMLENYFPSYNSTVSERLFKNFSPVLGKTNMDEFAMGSFGDTSAFFKAINPIDASRSAGGSSSGSAVAVSSGLCSAAIGSDTGGSVRIPASFCGMVGFKPTYGAISRYGLIAYASSLDTVGTIARTVEDTELLLKTLSGRDSRDMTSIDVEIKKKEASIRGLRLAFSENDLKTCHPSVSSAITALAKALSKKGALFVKHDFFEDKKMDEAYKILSCAEATSNLARFDGIKFGEEIGDVETTRGIAFGDEVKLRILFGNFVLAEENYEKYFLRATLAREKTTRKLDSLFEDADILMSPLCDFEVPLCEKSDSLRPDRFTVAANLSGAPAISLPIGKDSKGMPISVQLMSKKRDDAYLLATAKAVSEIVCEEGLYGV